MKSLKKNVIYSFAYQLLILIIPFISAPYLARVIGAEGIGVYTYSYSIALYFTYFTVLGLGNYGNRLIAASTCMEERSRLYCELRVLQGVCFFVTGTLYLLYILLLAQDKTAASLQMVFVVSSAFDINWFFFGLEDFKLTVLRNTFIKLLSLVCIFVFVKNQMDIYKYIAIMAGGYLFSQLLLFPFLQTRIRYTRVTISGVLRHIKPNFMLFIPVIATSIYKLMDKIMLGTMSTNMELGYYEGAEKIIQIPVALVTSIGTVMLPRMSKLLSEKKVVEARKYFSITMLLILAFTTAATAGIIVVGDQLASVYYGDDFIRSGQLMKLLSITVIFLGAGNVVRTQYLIPMHKDTIYIQSAILGACVNFVVNIVLIPKLNGVGACIGTIIAEVVVCAYQLFKVMHEVNWVSFIKDEFVFIFIGALMMIVIRCIPSLNNAIIDLLIKLFLGGFVFVLFSGTYLMKKKSICKMASVK